MQLIWDSYIQPPFYVRHFRDPENLLDITLVKLTMFDINEDLSVIAINFILFFIARNIQFPYKGSRSQL